jgi:hypothetical protein
MSGDEFERIRPEIRSLVERGNITSAELREIRCNSWEWEALVPAMNDEAFCERMQYTLDNCLTRRERPFTTYNQALEGLWAPELIRRFKAQLNNEQLTQACKNIGFDLTCGACAEQFFTGSRMHDHDKSCSTYQQCKACSIEAEIGTEEDPHPVPKRFHTCSPPATAGDRATPDVEVARNDDGYAVLGQRSDVVGGDYERTPDGPDRARLK